MYQGKKQLQWWRTFCRKSLYLELDVKTIFLSSLHGVKNKGTTVSHTWNDIFGDPTFVIFGVISLTLFTYLSNQTSPGMFMEFCAHVFNGMKNHQLNAVSYFGALLDGLFEILCGTWIWTEKSCMICFFIEFLYKDILKNFSVNNSWRKHLYQCLERLLILIGVLSVWFTFQPA